MNNTTRRTPQHVKIERYIQDDEHNRDTEAARALMFAERAANMLDPYDDDDARAVEIAVYMYARRSAHWGLEAMGERGPDRLATYYHRA